MRDFKEYLLEKKNLLEKELASILIAKNDYPEIINSAVHYSVFAGGKRIRPILALATYSLFSPQEEKAIPLACALECIHTYSLIHDDLPAMDNSDYRRGNLTCHKKYNEAIAILAGDALLTYAFQILADYNKYLTKDLKAEIILKIIQKISTASGINGLIGGQVIDLESENKEIDKKTLQYIHDNKTGALISAAVISAAILGEADTKTMQSLETYAESLGLAFQISDDILDVVGNEEDLGKPIGNDNKLHKATYPHLYGLEQSQFLAQQEVETALDSLEMFGAKANNLRNIAAYILKRNK